MKIISILDKNGDNVDVSDHDNEDLLIDRIDEYLIQSYKWEMPLKHFDEVKLNKTFMSNRFVYSE